MVPGEAVMLGTQPCSSADAGDGEPSQPTTIFFDLINLGQLPNNAFCFD